LGRFGSYLDPWLLSRLLLVVPSMTAFEWGVLGLLSVIAANTADKFGALLWGILSILAFVNACVEAWRNS
jgi:hypothetical protein